MSATQTTAQKALGLLLGLLLFLQSASALPAPCALILAAGLGPAEASGIECCCAGPQAPQALSPCCRPGASTDQTPDSPGPSIERDGCGCRIAPLPNQEPARPATVGVDGQDFTRHLRDQARRSSQALAGPLFQWDRAGSQRAGASPPPGELTPASSALSAPPRPLVALGALAAMAIGSGGSWAQRVLGTALL
ncbi:MAG: hypothetical protein QF724_02625 [Planctomycetota bacterium]|jgi:hypothetical protein|nr:hypothetical protein [Planctomycetota bacterium]MDP6955061.1 hypothetical protein [Planctomycetota bacterium]